jgi:hypothetical protein
VNTILTLNKNSTEILFRLFIKKTVKLFKNKSLQELSPQKNAPMYGDT